MDSNFRIDTKAVRSIADFRKEFPSLPIVGKNTTMTVRSLNEFFISDSDTDWKIKN